MQRGLTSEFKPNFLSYVGSNISPPKEVWILKEDFRHTVDKIDPIAKVFELLSFQGISAKLSRDDNAPWLGKIVLVIYIYIYIYI